MAIDVRPDVATQVSGQDTIFALSSGTPPAAIAVIRISGSAACVVAERLAGTVPLPRQAVRAQLRDPDSAEVIDQAVMLRFAGPRSATGEDVLELHLHGGRAVVAAMLRCLERLEGLRPARPGEFTRRAFENGRIDLAEAEGLADLLTAETESQRRAALSLAGGALSRQVGAWQAQLLVLAAEVEALLDFADEGDVAVTLSGRWRTALNELAGDLAAWLGRPPAERLRDGVRVVIAGPPNAGKSSLFNCLCGREAAITSALPGTTRDLVEAPTAIAGVPLLLIDTAGLRESDDAIEAIGVSRAETALADADIILWLGDPAGSPDAGKTIMVQSKADLHPLEYGADVVVSAVTGQGVDGLTRMLMDRAAAILPREGETAVDARHRALLAEASANLGEAASTGDALVQAEALRLARVSLDRITGRAGVEEMLDALFGRFCIGK